LLETVDAVAKAIGPDRVGVRLSPHGNFNDMHDNDPIALFTYLIDKLNPVGLAYLSFIEPRSSSIGLAEDLSVDSTNNALLFRRLFNGPVLSAGGYTAETASEAILAGNADAIGFGRAFIANPDLVNRLMSGATLNKYDRATFYGGAEVGYTDYPLLEPQLEAED
jgi:N-ethylmaleimide reductase